ncbi:MAG: P-type Cu2+ transporter, partial [Anaerophaga sp.]|nr:P-type Cu2+ transporter [Anaerophaga sp.]
MQHNHKDHQNSTHQHHGHDHQKEHQNHDHHHVHGNQEGHEDHGGHHGHEGHDHSQHHAMMIKDFRKRFWISLAISVPILALSPMIQGLLGFEFSLTEGYDKYLLFALSTLVFFYGGWPFLTGLIDELKKKQPGMMTLIAVAVTVAWGYSSATTFGLEGSSFFWELATLIDI